MKKYARLRPPSIEKFDERSNVLYNSRPEISLEEDPHKARPPPSDGSASPHRNSLPDFQMSRGTQREDHASSSGPSHTDLTEALKKLSTFQEGGSRGNSGRWQGGGGGNGEKRSRHGSGTWGASGGQEGGTSSGRWGPHDGSSGDNLFLFSAFLFIFCASHSTSFVQHLGMIPLPLMTLPNMMKVLQGLGGTITSLILYLCPVRFILS